MGCSDQFAILAGDLEVLLELGLGCGLVGHDNQGMKAESNQRTVLTYRLPTITPRAQHTLKRFALGLMIADHVHCVFFNRNLEWLYWLSRFVFPIFALTAAQNLEHLRANPQRYISRLLVWGVIAQPAYWVCFHAMQLNVLFTLASSIGTYVLLKTLKARGVHMLFRYAIVVIFSAVSMTFLEFGWSGVLAVPVFTALMRRGAWWDWLAAFVLAFGIVNFTAPWLMPLVAIALWILASRLPSCSSWKPNVWSRHATYAIYPLHLAVIAFVAKWLA